MKVESENKRSPSRDKNEGKTVHFATLMDFCHLKNSEWKPKVKRKTKGLS